MRQLPAYFHFHFPSYLHSLHTLQLLKRHYAAQVPATAQYRDITMATTPLNIRCI